MGVKLALVINLSVVEQRHRAVLAVERGEPKSVVAAQFGCGLQRPGWSTQLTVSSLSSGSLLAEVLSVSASWRYTDASFVKCGVEIRASRASSSQS